MQASSRDVALPARLDVPLELGMLRFPAVLSAVHVSDQELCPGSADRGAAFQLWEEARAGLLATVVARETNPAMAHFVQYDRHLSLDDDHVVTQTTHALSGVTTRPFVSSEPAPTFARTGYMHESGNDRVFDAPDADVLLDESFAAAHCFHLQRPDADHRGQAGLAFRPVQSRGRDTLVDVAGVIWIDETTPELRSLDFSYTALEPAAMEAGTGGQIQFHTMPNGIAFVERWHLRLPALTAPEPPVRHDPYTAELIRPPRRRQERYDLQVADVVEAGGVVLEARWPDGESWHEPTTGISGLVAQAHRADAGVANALVMLQGTNDTTSSDSSGHFRLDPVIPGKYTIVATDTALHEFTEDRVQGQKVTITRGDVASVRLELTPVTETVADLFRGASLPVGTSMLAGHLDLPDSVLPRDVHVRALWQSIGGSGRATLHAQNMDRDAPVDGRSRFVVCGLRREAPVTLQLTRDDVMLADTTFIVSDRLIVPVRWRAP